MKARPLSRPTLIALSLALCLSSNSAAQWPLSETHQERLPHRAEDRVPGPCVLFDMDGDGDLDACVTGQVWDAVPTMPLGGRTAIYRNDGQGRFVDVPGALPKIVGTIVDVVATDIDGDRDQDLLLVDGSVRTPRLHLLLGDGKGNFSDASSRLPHKSRPWRCIAAADLNGDGRKDVVAASQEWSAPETSVHVWLGQANGSFKDITSTAALPVRFTPTRVLIGDLDGDKVPDLYITRSPLQANYISHVFQGRGDGSFVDISAKSGVAGLLTQLAEDAALADFDGDGDLDVFLAREDTYGPTQRADRLYRNEGGFRFTNASLAALPALPGHDRVCVGDLDEDGDLDLVLAGANTPNPNLHIRSLHNDGQGKFHLVDEHRTRQRMINEQYGGLALGNLDGRPGLELLFTACELEFLDQHQLRAGTGWTAHEEILLGTADGRLLRTYEGDLPDLRWLPVASGDVNADGVDDLLVLRQTDATANHHIALYLGNGRGGFDDVSATHIQSLYQNPIGNGRAYRFADMDLDGDLDLLIIHDQLAPVLVHNQLLWNDGKGRFQDAVSFRLPKTLSRAEDLELADVNLDGRLDILISTHAYARGPSPNLLWLSDKQQGTWVDATAKNMPPVTAAEDGYRVLFFDADEDGDLDIWQSMSKNMRLLINSGQGGYGPDTNLQLPKVSERSALIDADGDGDQDVLEVDLNGGIQIFENVPGPAFVIHQITNGPRHPDPIAVFDIDGDGDQDFIVTGFGISQLYLNQGSMKFQEASNTAWKRPTGSAGLLGDYDGDGDLDLAQSSMGFYWNRTADHETPIGAAVGQTFVVRQQFKYQQPFTGLALSTLLLGVRQASTPIPPVGLLGIDGRALWIGAPTALRGPSHAGRNEYGIGIPNAKALVGLPLVTQSLLSVRTGSALRVQLTAHRVDVLR